MKRVYSAVNLPDAHIVANLLTQSGIAVQVFNTNAVGALGELPVDSAQPQVWIEDDAQETRARDLIETHQKAYIGPAQRLCPECGEMNPGNFETCWNCSSVFRPL